MPVSPHSLSFSPPGTPSSTKRTSLSQLPLPSTMTAAPGARRTHLPGINPSASFFRPSRPSFSRPSSSSSQPDEHPYDSDSFPLKRLHPLDEDDDHPPFRPTSKSSSVSSPSPVPSTFNPTPPPLPLNSIVATDPLTHRPIRRYAQHPSRNRFFLHGRLLTSGDTPWAFAAAPMYSVRHNWSLLQLDRCLVVAQRRSRRHRAGGDSCVPLPCDDCQYARNGIQ